MNHMYNLGIKDVDFIVCNTDLQALQGSPVPNKLQIGINLTGGLGAGANPEKGKNAAIESKEDIREMLSDGTKMIFITAGMGGGTGTGGAPIIAEVAREMEILTVGIVTAPFAFEGKKKTRAANEGIAALKANCDTVIVVSNDRIKEIFGNLAIREAFAEADSVLTTAAKGIAEIITVPGYVNVDFEDVKTVMLNAGAAVMGSTETSGENRARRAAEAALNSPLLNNHNIMGAEKILLSIMSGEEAELQMDELTDITDYIEENAGLDAEVIFGHGVDADLGQNIRVTVIATGFETSEPEMVLKSTEPLVQAKATTNGEQGDEEGDVRRVFDLESSRELDQPSLFEGDDEVPDHEETDDMSEPVPVFSKTDDSGKEQDFDFDFDFPEKEEEQEEDSEELVFDFEEDFEVVNESSKEEEEDFEIEELTDMAHPPSRKLQLMEARKKREEMLERASGKSDMINPETFKEKWEVPAFERKKVQLQRTPHSSERNISKFNLTDDNEILGNNKFLHDNVD